MSLALMFRGSLRTIVFVVCLSLSLAGQQSVQVQAVAAPSDQGAGTAAQGGTQAQAPLPSGPQPKASTPDKLNPAKGVGHFPNLIAPYRSYKASPAVLVNGTKLEGMIQNGKIMLSMNDAIAMALAT